jgi:hypothetical protein
MPAVCVRTILTFRFGFAQGSCKQGFEVSGLQAESDPEYREAGHVHPQAGYRPLPFQ